MKKIALIASLLLAATLGASAQPQGGPPPEGGEHRGPPPEAVAACKSAKAGADCSFTQQNRTMKGTCWAPEGKTLACRPKDMPPPPSGSASAPPQR
jgi:hypothetical protein